MPKRPSIPSGGPSPEALFRYRLVCEVLARVASGLRRTDAVREVARCDHPDFTARLRHVSERTLYRWLALYHDGGFDRLLPVSRGHTDSSAVLSVRFLDFLRQQKREDPKASVPELIRRAREHGVLHSRQPIDRSTVYRTLKRMGLPVRRRKRRGPDRDTRRFAYPHRMQMILCDGTHFRAGATRARRVALFFLDDATRLGLHVVVGTSESTALFLRGLYQTIRRHGIADIYYLDKGPGFKAQDSFEVVRKLNALLIHGETAYPQGHGKIERFNQTAKADLLRRLDGRADIDPDCGALELRLSHYLREVYNHKPHESLKDQTPQGRFLNDPRPLRLPDTDHELRLCFVLHVVRTVSADHVVSLDGVDYEVPQGHAKERITLYRRLLDGTVAMLHQGRLVELATVDLAQNARTRRARRTEEEDELQPPLPPSAADLAFQRAFPPVVDQDGGFEDPDPKE